MATGVTAVAAAAFALYVYRKTWTPGALVDGEDPQPSMQAPMPMDMHTQHPPNTWAEALLHVKEVFRYMYNETLGRWHTVDLFVGLAYLSHREVVEYPAADIAARGTPISINLEEADKPALLAELQELKRYLLYCKGLKQRRGDLQLRFWKEQLGADSVVVLKQQPDAGLLRPAYVLVEDRQLQAVVLCIRGTHSMKDLFTTLAGAAKPHHHVQQHHVVLGYSHLGMLAAARWMIKQVTPALRAAMLRRPDFCLRIVGHSMGGGTAALLTMMLRDMVPEAADARCYAIACPSCMTLELANSCREYVTSIINSSDIVPTFSAAAVDALREEVMHSSWFAEFQRDLRSSVVRALQGGMRGVGSATTWTARALFAPAAVPFRSCYSRRNVSHTGVVSPGLHPVTDMLRSASSGELRRAQQEDGQGDVVLNEPFSLPPASAALIEPLLQTSQDSGQDRHQQMQHQASPSGSLPVQPNSSMHAPSTTAMDTDSSWQQMVPPGQESMSPSDAQQQQQQPSATRESFYPMQHLRRRLWPWATSAGAGTVADGQTVPRSSGSSTAGPGSSGVYAGAVAVGVGQSATGVLYDSRDLDMADSTTSQPTGSPSRRGSPGGVPSSSSSQSAQQACTSSDPSAPAPATSAHLHKPSPLMPPPWRQAGGRVLAASVTRTRAAAKGAGDWLWGGMFQTCTAPRNNAGAFASSARNGGGSTGIVNVDGRADQMHLPQDLDELSLPGMRGAGGVDASADGSSQRQRRAPIEVNGSGASGRTTSGGGGYSGSSSDAMAGRDDDEELDDEEEEEVAAAEAAAGLLSGALGLGAGNGAQQTVTREQHLQHAGITAVVAAMTDQSEEIFEAREEAARAAETVLREAASEDTANAEGTGRAGGRDGGASVSAHHAGAQGSSGIDRELPLHHPSGSPAGHGLRSGLSDPDQVQHSRSGASSYSSGRGGGTFSLPIHSRGGGLKSKNSKSAQALGAIAEGASTSGNPVPSIESLASPADANASSDQVMVNASPAVGRTPSGGLQQAPKHLLLYPAGRILHFFPASVLQHNPHTRNDDPDSASLAHAAAAAASAAAAAAAAGGDFAAATTAAAVGAAESAESTAAGAAAAAAVVEPSILFEVLHNEAYGRIKLCRTMVTDHLVPAYLVALESVMRQLQAPLPSAEQHESTIREDPGMGQAQLASGHLAVA